MVLCYGSPKETKKSGQSSGIEEWNQGNGIKDGSEKIHSGDFYEVILADLATDQKLGVGLWKVSRMTPSFYGRCG